MEACFGARNDSIRQICDFRYRERKSCLGLLGQLKYLESRYVYYLPTFKPLWQECLVGPYHQGMR